MLCRSRAWEGIAHESGEQSHSKLPGRGEGHALAALAERLWGVRELVVSDLRVLGCYESENSWTRTWNPPLSLPSHWVKLVTESIGVPHRNTLRDKLQHLLHQPVGAVGEFFTTNLHRLLMAVCSIGSKKTEKHFFLLFLNFLNFKAISGQGTEEMNK